MMQVYSGNSSHSETVSAIDEATASWPAPLDFSPDMIFVFHSTAQNGNEVAAELGRRFPTAQVAGCSTAGEWFDGEYHKGSLAITAIASSDIRWSIQVVESLDGFSDDSAREVFDSLLCRLGLDISDLTPKRHFCIGLIDGVAGVDGSAVGEMGNVLGNVPFIGGMAGDDLRFEQTHVIGNGKAYVGGAVFILADSDVPFQQLKHQHFVPGKLDVVITAANQAERRVLRLDGLPAAERYAELIGCRVEELDFQTFSEHPLIYRYGNDVYVRTVYRADSDGSLVFYCCIEEGMVLNLCEHRNMTDELRREMAALSQHCQQIQLLFVCNCSFRSLEASGKNLNQGLSEITGSVAEHVIGFDTYGELWNGIHINQTMVALALGCE